MLPTASDLVARFPEFAAVDGKVIDYWINDATDIVKDWGEETGKALITLAAHNMVINRVLKQDTDLPAGVTRFKSASMDVAVSEIAANAGMNGGWGASVYGQQFAVMQRRNSGFPRLVGYVEPRGVCWS